jgi:hypothetical protein
MGVFWSALQFLVDWLHVAATIKVAAIIELALAPTAPLMDSALQARLLCTARQDLLGWCTTISESTRSQNVTNTRSHELELLMTKFLVRQRHTGSTGVSHDQLREATKQSLARDD